MSIAIVIFTVLYVANDPLDVLFFGITAISFLNCFVHVFSPFRVLVIIIDKHIKNIHCSLAKKIGYTFTFPLFMLTYVPISVIALFKKVKWEPIKHSVSMSVYDICPDKAAIETQESLNN
jgi:hypothetical protein